MNLNKSIPKLCNSSNWGLVTIIDNGEKLVSLNNLTNENSRIILDPIYFLDGIEGSINDIYVREEVKSLLVKASIMLPDGYKFVIWDGWRPLIVQKNLFNNTFENFRKENSKWGSYSDEDLKTYIAINCCALPSYDLLYPSPHSTGGSVDLSIIDDKGDLIKMGTNFDDFKDNVSTRYYEEKIENGQNLSQEEMDFLNNRRLLYNIMSEVGFVNFSEEWWHFSFGNQAWGDIKGETAIYGAASL